jgi:hypothetical protein
MVVMHHTAQQGTVIMPHFYPVLFLSLGNRGQYFLSQVLLPYFVLQYQDVLEKK